MLNIKKITVFLLVLGFSLTAIAQQNTNDGSQSQRLEVMRSKLETMRRSLNSAITALKDDAKDNKDKKDDKKNADTPVSRLKGLEKEVGSLISEVGTLKGKVERSEKFDGDEINQLETSTNELQARVDTALLETASARSVKTSDIGGKREKKKKKKFLGLFGGGTDEYEELLGEVKQGRDRELFVYATKEVRKGNHEVGRLLFQTIISTYPESPYLPMAKLAIADSFYLEGTTSNLIQAAAAYQDWLTFFPTHPLADRVALKVAESEMRQIGRPDRDATRAKRAEQRLKVLLQQYPKSELREVAQDRLREVQDNLGLHNLWIANFYYKRAIDQKIGGLKGAQSRYLEILEKYPKFGWMDEALYNLAVTYQAEEETDEAAKYFQRLVRDYPNSSYMEKAKEQLQLIGAKVPEPNPERMNVKQPEGRSFLGNFTDELFGNYELTIDKNGVLMTKDFDKEKFDLIDEVIKNGGDLPYDQIPKFYQTPKKKEETQSIKSDK
jgi:outer membrane protein assembly factor BamD